MIKHFLRAAGLFVSLVFASILGSSLTFASDDITLRVEVVGAKPSSGQIVLSLFDSATHHLKKPLVSLRQNVDAKGKASFQLSGLDDALYSVSVFYDEDQDGKLNTNFIGIPTELVGFSNNAKGRFGPPTFEQTKIRASSGRPIKIHLNSVGQET